MLKRTCKPFYGKLNARLDNLAREAMKRGDRDEASRLFSLSLKTLSRRSAS